MMKRTKAVTRSSFLKKPGVSIIILVVFVLATLIFILLNTLIKIKKEPTRIDDISPTVTIGGIPVNRPGFSSEGATALCNDGTYDYHKNKEDNCQHHKGIKQLLP